MRWRNGTNTRTHATILRNSTCLLLTIWNAVASVRRLLSYWHHESTMRKQKQGPCTRLPNPLHRFSSSFLLLKRLSPSKCCTHGTFRCCAPFHEIPRRTNKRLFKKENKNSLWGTDFVSVCVWMYTEIISTSRRTDDLLRNCARWMIRVFFPFLFFLVCISSVTLFGGKIGGGGWVGLTTHEPPQPPIAYVKLPKSIKTTERKEEKKKKEKHDFGFKFFYQFLASLKRISNDASFLVYNRKKLQNVWVWCRQFLWRSDAVHVMSYRCALDLFFLFCWCFWWMKRVGVSTHHQPKAHIIIIFLLLQNKNSIFRYRKCVAWTQKRVSRAGRVNSPGRHTCTVSSFFTLFWLTAA